MGGSQAGGRRSFRCTRTATAPLLSFTPQAAAGAWAGALLLRDGRAAATAALAGRP